MKKTRKFLIILFLFLSGVIIVGLSSTQGIAKTTGNMDLNASESPSVIYIYKNDLNIPILYGDLITDAGYLFESINISEISASELATHDLIIIGPDTSSGVYTWGTRTQCDIVNNANKSVIGIHYGGASFFENISLYIRRGNTWTASGDGADIFYPTHPVFNNPSGIPKSNPLKLYDTANSMLAVYVNNSKPIPDNITRLCLQTGYTTHYPVIMQLDQYLLWGFQAEPSYMTEEGKKLFVNCIYYLIGSPDIAEPVITEPIPGFEIVGVLVPIMLLIFVLIRKKRRNPRYNNIKDPMIT
ncbi:MAG: hypothetical protein GF329_04790 [Candidatus Lokiarchaeota archaeon]|nr:hypothetical protein [Candidatus Lokiarchaeota archaeon]